MQRVKYKHFKSLYFIRNFWMEKDIMKLTLPKTNDIWNYIHSISFKGYLINNVTKDYYYHKDKKTSFPWPVEKFYADILDGFKRIN